MTKKIAFVATSYIKNYDGISVYTENLLLEFLKQIKNEDILVDIYTGSSVLELLINRISSENLLSKNINVKPVNDKKFIVKMLDLNFQLIKNGRYDLILMSNFMPTLLLPSKTLKVIHDFSVNNFSELYSKGYLIYHNMLLRYAKYFDNAIGYISNTTLADLDKFHGINNSNKKLVYLPNGIPADVKALMRSNEPFAMPHMTIIPKDQTFDKVLENVGATIPSRDIVDQRIVEEVRTGQAYYVKKLPKKNPYGDFWGLADKSKAEDGSFKYRRLDKESYKLGIITDICQVGGFPKYKKVKPYVDTDGDGMPDEWEIANGLNPNDPSDANKDCTGDGYTNIEKYINGISTKEKVDWTDMKNNHDTLAEKGKLL